MDEKTSRFSVNGRSVGEGDWITVDGSSGKVFAGQAALIAPELSGNFNRVMKWADRIMQLRVRVNADTPADAHRGRDFGAEGIGLCRTEHMFFTGDRLLAMREMIVAQDIPGRKRALAKLLPMQRGDFEAIFRAMEGYPVTIRLLDPPLHEFLPQEPAEIEALGQGAQDGAGRAPGIVERLHEVNPMLGLRGCRLGIIYPEITEMQVRAIFEAACTVAARKGRVMPEVMIPLTASVVEFRKQALIVRQVAEEVFQERQITVPYLLGTMIELPRAALTADEIAREAQFFSFGTNDLTQTTWGLSRDDAGKFLPYYLEHGVIEDDPFQVLDQAGVGKLISMACDLGRRTRPDLKLGICGEHGGEPAAVTFCDRLGMNYVSCSPFRVPIARLAAAQAALGRPRHHGPHPGDRLATRSPKDTMTEPLVGIVMGSDSDWEVMQHAARRLTEFGVAHESRVVSAHRTPDQLYRYAEDAASAGTALHHRRRRRGGPPSRHARGQDDAARARRADPHQAPPGTRLTALDRPDAGRNPVATFAIGTAGAGNAGLYAVAILALNDTDLGERLEEFRRTQERRVLDLEAAGSLVILPGATVGVVGGGQLGRMFTLQARTMGYRSWCSIRTR